MFCLRKREKKILARALCLFYVTCSVVIETRLFIGDKSYGSLRADTFIPVSFHFVDGGGERGGRGDSRVLQPVFIKGFIDSTMVLYCSWIPVEESANGA